MPSASKLGEQSVSATMPASSMQCSDRRNVEAPLRAPVPNIVLTSSSNTQLWWLQRGITENNKTKVNQFSRSISAWNHRTFVLAYDKHRGSTNTNSTGTSNYQLRNCEDEVISDAKRLLQLRQNSMLNRYSMGNFGERRPLMGSVFGSRDESSSSGSVLSTSGLCARRSPVSPASGSASRSSNRIPKAFSSRGPRKEKLYYCHFCNNGRGYGTLSALALHLRIKHAAVVRYMLGLTETDAVLSLHARSIGGYINGEVKSNYYLPRCSIEEALHACG